ncbi:hypothetical protein BO79DRAFT_32428 [Aspergillus costaricaensis CBS 115574]|uniref:Uncharacterized protein n=1 Tax=Aspergillus costaricaensis CBS 115574 TaxID=1448317 RepID=A0ACD1IAE6_9EURO|nr:hypothetical protein BO79DRAFT_32428 [Aspergillus costaricaensis CBS 115574]RAK87237.1 hypothetical protein BO79DRAFT_32428 [Aspergillus costaricaensis CBS 115574]
MKLCNYTPQLIRGLSPGICISCPVLLFFPLGSTLPCFQNCVLRLFISYDTVLFRALYHHGLNRNSLSSLRWDWNATFRSDCYILRSRLKKATSSIEEERGVSSLVAK